LSPLDSEKSNLNNMENYPKILVVEDEEDIRDGLVRALMYKGNWPEKMIEDVDNAESAIDVIETFRPDIVLLDLKIPKRRGEKEEIRYAVDILKEIDLYNYKNNANTKVIVISASVDDPGMQRLVLGDRSNVISFLDKNEMAIESDEFKDKLIKRIRWAFESAPDERRMDYSAIRRSVIRELKGLNNELFEKIDKEVITEFEKLNDKGTNIHKKSKDVIVTCGEIVEEVLAFFKTHTTKLADIKYLEDITKVRNRLTALTGRIATRVEVTDERGEKRYQIHFKPNGETELITRFAAEAAFMAYNLRSEAVHGGKEDDERNAKLFANKYLFTREDAAVSVNLIMPLIRDYIIYLKTQKKAK